MIPLLIVLLVCVSAAPYCTFSGCAQPSHCRCASSVAECDITDDDPDGTCRFTALGIGLTVVGGLVLVALLSALVSALSCLRKVFCCCCKKDKHVHYHNSAQATHDNI
jgi:hypothetical protein